MRVEEKMNKIMIMVFVGLFLFGSMQVEASLNDKDQRLMGEYDSLRGEYKLVKEEWSNAKEEYISAKKQYKRDKLSVDEQEEKFGIAKNFVSKTLERIDAHINILANWAERVIQDEELQNEVISELNGYLLEIDEFQLEVESAKDIHQLREISKDVREYWGSTRVELKKYVGIILTERTNNVISRAERLSERLHFKIDTLNQDNDQVMEMQNLLSDFDSKIKFAKEDYSNAKAVYSRMDNLQDFDKLLREIKDYLSDSKKYLRESHKSLRELVKIYRSFTGDFPNLGDSE